MSELLQYRFPAGPDGAAEAGLGGHAVGNLLIAAMIGLEDGDVEEGVRRLNRILAVRGQVVPASGTPLVLHARRSDGTVLDGQSVIMRTPGIERVWITPEDAPPAGDALAAIAEADLVILGPGSLYTSLLPSLLIPAIREAVLASSAPRLFVCNVATQQGETEGMDLAAHVRALVEHTAPGICDIVLANDAFDTRVPDGWGAESVRLDWPPAIEPLPRLVLDAVVDPDNAHHHDPGRLASAVLRAFDDELLVRRRDPGGRP